MRGLFLFHVVWRCLVIMKVEAAHVVESLLDSNDLSFTKTLNYQSMENVSMNWKIRGTCLPGFALLIAVGGVCAQPVNAQLPPPTRLSYGGSVPNSKEIVSGIAWYGVLTEGLAEAKRTRKPILFITAAAQCRGVPGMW